jgi:hypothetical protein
VIDLLTTTVSVLAEAPKNTGPDFGKASPVGLLVIVLLLIGVFLLVRSMNRHLKKVPASFDAEQPVSDAGRDEGQDGTADGPDPEKPPREPGG